MKEILEYTGNIAMVQRWAQELLGYHFSILHRSNQMMIDVDALSRRFGSRITSHLMISKILSSRDVRKRPFAYDIESFQSSQRSKMDMDEKKIEHKPVLISKRITSIFLHANQHPTRTPSAPMTLVTQPLRFVDTIPGTSTSPSTPQTISHQVHDISTSLIHFVLSVNDISGSSSFWLSKPVSGNFHWSLIPVFTDLKYGSLYPLIYFDQRPIIKSWTELSNIECNIFDVSYIKVDGKIIPEWLSTIYP